MQTACLSQPLNAATAKEFRILPAGMFRSADGSGRPANVAGWVMNERIAHQIMASLKSRKDDVLIDYEHQSMGENQNGGPIPAAGWFKRAVWRDGDGLYATDVQWTNKAAALIANKEYRFVSPVFLYDGRSGEVTGLVAVGLVNRPALDGLTDLAAASARFTGNFDVDRSIEVFNRSFGAYGVFHPQTPANEVARLKAELEAGQGVAALTAAKPVARNKASLAGLSETDAAKMRAHFPDVFE